MQPSEEREEIPTWAGIAGALFLIVSFAYALISGLILLWVISVIGIGFSAGMFYLFYRLVRAVEEIARNM